MTLSGLRDDVLSYGMAKEQDTDALLDHIIIYGLSLAFGLVIASVQALRSVPGGFAFAVTWRTFLACAIAEAVLIPCFRIIVHSERKALRRFALVIVCLTGVGAFFYPLRFVPREKMADIFTGLGMAVLALSLVGVCLLVVRRLFEPK